MIYIQNICTIVSVSYTGACTTMQGNTVCVIKKVVKGSQSMDFTKYKMLKKVILVAMVCLKKTL